MSKLGRTPRRLRERALVRDDWRCQNCDTIEGRLEVHHLTSREEGGTDELTNLQTLCVTCHIGIHRERNKLAGYKARMATYTEAQKEWQRLTEEL